MSSDEAPSDSPNHNLHQEHHCTGQEFDTTGSGKSGDIYPMLSPPLASVAAGTATTLGRDLSASDRLQAPPGRRHRWCRGVRERHSLTAVSAARALGIIRANPSTGLPFRQQAGTQCSTGRNRKDGCKTPGNSPSTTRRTLARPIAWPKTNARTTMSSSLVATNNPPARRRSQHSPVRREGYPS